MKITNILYISALLLAGTSCSDYLETETPDQFSDLNFWTGESNVRTYNWEFYELFEGYGNGSVPGDFYFTSFTDDQASPSFQQFPVTAPASSGAWDWYYIRKANVMLERIDEVPMSDEAKNHWKGVARFFRAFDYFNKVRLFGDVPWISKSLDIAETDLIYKPRDPRVQVMDSILADIDFAIENLRAEDEENTVNKDVALALKSRICLYAGTYRKYHTELGLPDAAAFLLEAKEASETLIDGGSYSLGDYKDLYSSMDLAGNPGVLLYKKYLAGILTHAVIGFTNSSTQMRGLTKSAVDSYPMEDGLPISQSTLYMGDDNIEDVRANRGARLLETISNFLAYEGNLVDGLSSSTGYRPAKFLQPASIQLAPQNETDAPVFWLAEVLLNYAEASAELDDLGEYVMTQADLDKSVNLLRDRAGVARLTLSGQNVSASGVMINDPERDADVSPLIWEIRRERRIELMMDGFRYQDLMRWKKGEYLDTEANPECILGAKVPDNPDVIRNEDGYITPYEPGTTRNFVAPKHYLSPVPTGQISLYPEGVLEQNPGWE